MHARMYECMHERTSRPNSNNLCNAVSTTCTTSFNTSKSTFFLKLTKYVHVVKAKDFLIIKKYFSSCLTHAFSC